MKIIVAAVPGAGKTTTLKMVKEKIPSAKIVNVGSMILDIAKKKLGIRNRDQLRKRMTMKQNRDFQAEAMRKVAKMKGRILILDTHISIKTPNGYFPGLSERIVHILEPDMIVLLEFRPKDVLERRRNDKSRRRDEEAPKEVEDHQTFNRELAFAAASHSGAGVEVINLRYRQKRKLDHARKAAYEIVKLIKSQQS